MIQRHHLWYNEYGNEFDMVEKDDGEWVKWEDVCDLLPEDIDLARQRAVMTHVTKGCKTEYDFDTGEICVVSSDGLKRTLVYNTITREEPDEQINRVDTP